MPDSPTAWWPHPDAALEQWLAQGPAQALFASLQQPRISADRYARLRVLDRLHRLQPDAADLRTAWMQAMLLANRPAPVWSVTRHWPSDTRVDADDLLLAAQVAQVMGAHDEARTRYHALLARLPEAVDVWQKYVDFERPAHITVAHVAQIETLHANASSAYVREKAAFALARCVERQAPGRAFVLAQEAHRLKRVRLGPWPAAQTQQRLDLDALWQPSPDPASAQPAPAQPPRPLFIVGLPRSGTTLLSSLLGAHSRVASVGEQNLMPTLAASVGRNPAAADPRLSAFVQSWYRAAVGDLAGPAAVTIDKLPANVEYIGLILALIPDAVVVHLERALPDCAISMHLRDFEFGCLYSDSARDLAAYAGMAGAHARMWQQRAIARVLHLRYEAIVADPRAALAPLLAALDLAWEPQMLDFWQRAQQIGTYSEAQVRQPVHGNAVGGWRRFLPQAADYFADLGVPPDA